MSYTIDFNAGVDGANIAAGGGVTAVSGTPKYTNVNAHGGMAMIASSGTASTCIRCDTSPTTHTGSIYMRIPITPDTHIRFVSFGNLANSTTVCNIRLKSDRTWTLANAVTTDTAIGTTVIPLNQWVRIDWHYDNADTAAPILTARLFLNAEGTVHDEELTWTFTGTTNVFDRINMGVVGSASVTNRQIQIDTVRITDGIGSWPAPFNPPTVADENVIYGPIDYYQSGRTLPTQATGRAPKDLMTNDVLLATLSISATQGVAPTIPAGWSLLVPVQNPSGGCVVYAYRVAPGTVGQVSTIADTTFTFSWGTAGKATLQVLPIGGVDSAAPFNVPTVAVESTTQTSHNCPAFTPSVSGRRLNVVTFRGSTIQVLTKPAGDTLRGETYGLKGSGNAIGMSDSTTNIASGAQGTKAWTTDLAVGAGTMLSVVVKPSVAAIGTRKFQGATRHMIAQAITSSSFKVYGKVINGTSIRLAYSVNSDMSSPSFIAAQVPDSRGYVRFSVPSLSPGATYYYQFMDTPTGLAERAISDIGKVKTLKVSGSQQSFNFAFGGCTLDESPTSAALDNIRTWNPDFMVHLGDFHYQNPGESATVGTEILHERYFEGQIENAAGLKTLLRNVNFFYGRSDHESVEIDNGDTNIPMNADGLRAYKNIFPNTIADTRNPTVGVYQSWVVGRVRFIHLDIRNSDRSSGSLAQGSSKTMLGATQKQWLKDRLLDPEPVKIILSDEGWNHAADMTGDPVAWWAYDDERTEIGNFIVNNGVRVFFCASNDHKLHADDGTNNLWGGFPVVGAAPFDNVGGGVSVAQQEYSSGAARGSQYGRVEVTDDGSTISITYRGWDALTDTQKITLTETYNTDTPVVWNGAGNETTASISNGQDITLTKPSNVVSGEYMLAQIFHRTAYGPGFDQVPGWNLINLINTTYTMALYWRKADGSDTPGKQYTWHTGGASSRGFGRLVRMTGAHPTAPIDIVGSLAANTGTTSIVLPGLDPGTTNSLLVGVAAAGRSALPAPAFTAPPGMNLVGNGSTDDGSSSSGIGMFTQSLGNDTPTGDRTAAISPTAANSVGFMFAVRALNSPVAPSTSRVVLHAMTATSFKVRYRVFNGASVRLVVSPNAGMTTPVFSNVSTPDVDGFGTCTISSLNPDTPYWYRLELDGTIDTTLTVPVRTHEANPSAFSFLAASCAVTGSNDGVFTAMKDRVGADTKKARFFAHIGDWDYTWGNGGVTPDDMNQIINARELAFLQPNQAALYREISLNYGWSDVDFGGSNSDGTAPAKATMQSAFRKLWDGYTLPSTVGGIQRAWTIGRIRFIHTDHRSMSSPKADADTASKTLLGAEQKAWFKAELLAAKNAKQLVVWFGDNLWTRAQETPDGNRDGWSVYHTERMEIANYITTNAIKVYYIHGDTHSLLADDGTNNPFGGFPFACVAPMHQQAPVTTGTYSNGRYPDTLDGTIAAAHQYGWFDVTDNGTDITLVMKGFTGEGTQRITMTSVFNIPTATPPVLTRWNGVTEDPLQVSGVWNGVTTVPAVISLAP